MAEIHLLTSAVFNRIAAGEVVERPFSVVKELVENAIDAGARNIAVRIYDGGISRICVSDDGCGIEKSQLKKALLPHATSKIGQISDLDDIRTLGFRGEALASIASVAHVRIRSRAVGAEYGAEIRADGGEISDVSDCAAAQGTEISVDALFYNTPVRAKFLKAPRSEESDITNLMTRLILGNPDVAFRYFADDKQIFQSFGTGAEEAMIAVYGASVIADCFKIEAEKNGIRFFGYIGKHHYTKPNRTYQSLFVNGRYIVNASVSGAIQNAYGSYLMKRQYPFFVLSLEMPSDEVDVNVHPNKTDVRFRSGQKVFGTVYSVVSAVLDGTSSALDIVKTLPGDKGKAPDRSVSRAVLPPRPISEKSRTGQVESVENKTESPALSEKRESTPNYIAPPKREIGSREIGKFLADARRERETEGKILLRDSKNADAAEEMPRESEKISEKREQNKNAVASVQSEMAISERFGYVGQIFSTYLVFERKDEVYLVDQHAAHERLNYDKYMAELESRSVATQSMLVPFLLRVNGQETEFLRDRQGLLSEMGFEIEEFGTNVFRVSAVPLSLGDIRLEDFFADLLSGEIGAGREKTAGIVREKIAQTACKASVKSGNKITEGEAVRLLERMKGNMGLRCPHGRPVAVRLTRSEIDRWFKRIV